VKELGAYELPNGWRWSTIPNLVGKDGLFCDGDWIETEDQDPNGDVRLVQLADVGDGYYRDKSARFLTASKAVELRCTFLKPGDVLVARMPDPLGRACIFPGDKKRSVTAVDVCIVRSHKDDFNHRWLAWFVNAPPFRAAISGLQSGSTRKRISRKNLGTIPLPVPPLDRQHEIVAEIEKQFARLEAGVAGLRRVQGNLKRYRGAVLKAACEGKLVPTEAERARQEGRNYETGAQLLERILTERRQKWKGKGKYKEPAAPDAKTLAPLPEGWTWVTWDTVLVPEDGAFKRGPFGGELKKSIFVQNGFKVYEQYCPINDDCSFGRYYISPEKFNELRAFEVKAGDYLISCSGVTLGRITRVPNDFERGIINQALLRVRIDETVISPRYFIRLFRSSFFQELLFDASTGSAIPNVKGVRDLKALPLPLPSLAEQQRIVAEVERRLSVVEELEAGVNANLQRASRLRQSVLERAFKGELLSPAPNQDGRMSEFS